MRLPSPPHTWLTVSRRHLRGSWLFCHLFSIYRWAKSPPMRKVVMHVTSSIIGLYLMLPYVERALRFSLGWLLLGMYGYVNICFVGCLWTSSFFWNITIITIWQHIYEVYRPHEHDMICITGNTWNAFEFDFRAYTCNHSFVIWIFVFTCVINVTRKEINQYCIQESNRNTDENYTLQVHAISDKTLCLLPIMLVP